jgi:hypothetical protein
VSYRSKIFVRKCDRENVRQEDCSRSGRVSDSLVTDVEIGINGVDQALQKMSEEQPYQLTLFSNGAEGFNFGAGIVWGGCGSWQTGA